MFNFMRLPPLRRLMLMKAITGGGSWSTISGNPVSFTAKAATLRQLSVAFSPVQEGSGDPSPDNVRPILGWDSVNVWHSGADTSNPQTISITLGSTVYSGTVDVVTGVVTVTHGMVDCGAVTWSMQVATVGGVTHYFFARNFANIRVPANGNETPAWPLWAEQYVVVRSNGIAANKGHWAIQPSGNILISTGETTNPDVKPAGKIVYELATPQTIQLTPQEVSSLLGENNMWSDANGDLTVEYRSN